MGFKKKKKKEIKRIEFEGDEEEEEEPEEPEEEEEPEEPEEEEPTKKSKQPGIKSKRKSTEMTIQEEFDLIEANLNRGIDFLRMIRQKYGV